MVYMKRVVAVPGDHIQYYDRQMTLNGQRAALTLEGRDGPYQRAKETIDGRVTTVALHSQSPFEGLRRESARQPVCRIRRQPRQRTGQSLHRHGPP
jgi:hypothetical protein